MGRTGLVMKYAICLLIILCLFSLGCDGGKTKVFTGELKQLTFIDDDEISVVLADGTRFSADIGSEIIKGNIGDRVRITIKTKCGCNDGWELKEFRVINTADWKDEWEDEW